MGHKRVPLLSDGLVAWPQLVSEGWAINGTEGRGGGKTSEHRQPMVDVEVQVWRLERWTGWDVCRLEPSAQTTLNHQID